MKALQIVGFVLGLVLAGPAVAEKSASAEGASVYFVNLEDGATVSSPVKVIFGLSGMGIAPAGVEAENSGHHHVLVNRAPFGEAVGDKDALEYGLPANDNHRHFGKGQTETTIDLPAGTHTLQLVLGDWSHIPHDTPVTSDVITIVVE